MTGFGIDCGEGGTGDCSEPYPPPDFAPYQDTLTATPAPGFQFGAWTGCDAPSGNQCTMYMTTSKTVSVTFTSVTTTHALTVTLTGSGAGSVTSDLAGINCPSDCVEAYFEGTAVTLSATPASTTTEFPGTAHVFLGWGGCDSTSGTTCRVMMNAARFATATFEARHQLAVSPAPNNGRVTATGIDCGTGGSGECFDAYPISSVVALSAIPMPGYEVGPWTGCDSVTGSQCNVTMNAPRSVSVTFTQVFFLLSVSMPASGSVLAQGINCGGSGTDCSEPFAATTQANLYARPEIGYEVGAWTGCDSANGRQCLVTMNGARTVSVTFRRIVANLVSSAPALTNPGALATDGVNLYIGNGTSILAMPLDGGGVTTLYANAAPCCVVNLARIGTDLYWIDPNGDPDATAIFRGSTSGGLVTKIYSGFATGQPIVDGVGITTDGAKLYTSDEVNGRVHSLNPDGSGIVELGRRYGGFFDIEHWNVLTHHEGWLYVLDGGHAGAGIEPQVVRIPAFEGVPRYFSTLARGAPFVNPVAIAMGGGKIFVADPGAGNTIWQMSLPGLPGGEPTALVSGAPFVRLNGLLFHNNGLYVADDGNTAAGDGPGAIYRIDLSPVALVSDDPALRNPGALATDGANLYIANSTSVLSMPLAGGPVTTLYANAAPCCVVGLTQLGTDLYWIDPNGDPDATAIFRGSTGGGPLTKIYSGFATGQPIVDGASITSDGTKLYTSDYVQGRVHSLDPNGSAITQLGARYGGFFDLEHLNVVTESGGVLYIADSGDRAVAPQVVSIPTSGGSFTTLHVGAPFVRPVAIAVGNGTIFVADPGAGNTIWQLPLTGGAPTALVSGQPFVQLAGLLFHENFLYVSGGAVYRVRLAAAQPYALSVSPAPANGTVTGPAIDCGSGSTGDCTESYGNGANVTLFANPASGYQVGTWTGCDNVSGGQCTVTMNAARTVSGSFTPTSFMLSVSPTPVYGYVYGSGIYCGAGYTDCTEAFASGASVTLYAYPSGGYQVSGWSGCDSPSGTQCTITMNAAKTLAATFAAVVSTYTLTVSPAPTSGYLTGPGISCGTATTGDCTESFAYGAYVTLSAYPASGYQVGTWTGCDSFSGGTCYVTMYSAKNVSVSFFQSTFLLTVSSPANGYVSGSGINCGTTGADCSEPFAAGTPVTLFAYPSTGYQVSMWTGCDSVSGGQCTVTMNAARTISVAFTPTMTLTVSPTPVNGRVTGPGIDCGVGGTGDCTEPFASNSPVTLFASPVSGFRVGAWTGCDSASAGQCTVTMNAARAVSVTFTPTLEGPSTSGRFEVGLTCLSTAARSSIVDVTVTLANGTNVIRTVTRGALAFHAGKLRLLGPRAFSVAVTVDPGQTVTVPLQVMVPAQAESRTFLSVGMAFFGQVGADAKRRVLGQAGCIVEIQ